MNCLVAKPVIKNKFWIVEDDGEQVATIQAIDDGSGVTYVHGDHRERFHSIKLLSSRYNIHIARSEFKNKKSSTYEIYGYPVVCKPYNPLFDVQRRLPIFTKSSKSKSFYCAGYYLVNINETWTKFYCPKLIILNRNTFFGPFKQEEDLPIQSVTHG